MTMAQYDIDRAADKALVSDVAWALHQALMFAGDGRMRLAGRFWTAALHDAGRIHNGDMHCRAQFLVLQARDYIEAMAAHMLSVLAPFWNGNTTYFHTLGRNDRHAVS
jgi:hypothetical protein